MDKIKIERTWLQGSPVQVDNLMGNAFVGEAGAHEFLVSGKDNAGNVVPITGTITGKFLSSTMTTFALSGYVAEGVASVTLPSECYGAPGQFVVSIFATNGSTTTCIYCGVGSIFRTSTAAIAYPTTTLPDLTLLINQLDDVIASFPADLTHLLGAIAPTFVDNQPFTAGQYVWYNQVLYRFTADHPAGSWAGSADTVVAVIGTELNSTVRYTQQVLTDAQKTVARTNIDAADADDVTDLELTTVQVTPQTFDDNSKSQARSNIGAASSGDLNALSTLVNNQGGYISDLNAVIGTVPTGETVEGQITDLKSAITNTENRIKSYDGKIIRSWEIGTLNQNTNLTPPCIYAHGTNGIYTTEKTTVHLYPGDVFSVTNFTGLKISAYGRKTSDSTTAIKANQTSAIVIQYEGDYALSVAYTDTAVVANLNTLMALVILQRYTNTKEDVKNIQNSIEPYNNIRLGNLMPDLSEWITGRVYSGDYSDAITTVKCTDYIPVIGGKTYYIYGGYISQEYFGVYDENKIKLTGWSFTSVSANANNGSTAIITLNQSARYIRINLMINKIDLFPTDAYIGLFPNCLPKKLDLSDYIPRSKGNGTLSDKKVLVIGDSISTDVYGSYKKWVTFLCENCFFSSGFVHNDSYHATGYVATYKESGVVKKDTFLNRVSEMDDLDEYDLIITFGGINDWIQSVDFDDFKDAVDAYYAYLIEHATQARIAVISPLHTSLYGTNNTAGKTQKDYADYIKSVALDYALPVLNLTDESGFCPDKSNTFRDMWTLLPSGSSSHDGVHPTEDWEKEYLAPQIAWFLAGII